MDINIILEPDLSPAQFAEIAVEAERLGVRAIWSSNYHMHYDPFLLLAPAAAATSRDSCSGRSRSDRGKCTRLKWQTRC